MHYAAHYADVEQSLQSVTSGNQFVLTICVDVFIMLGKWFGNATIGH